MYKHDIYLSVYIYIYNRMKYEAEISYLAS